MDIKDKRKALGRGLESLLPSRGPGGTATTAEGAAGAKAVEVGIAGSKEIPVELIDRNPYQTRGKIDETALAELTASIKASGVLQPVLVRPVTVGDKGSGQSSGASGQEGKGNSGLRQGGTASPNVIGKPEGSGTASPNESGAGESGKAVVRYQLMAGERRWLASKAAGKLTIPAIVKQVSDVQAMEITIIENLQREDLNAMEQARAFERLSREFQLTQDLIAIKTGKDRTTVSNFMRLLKLPMVAQSAIEDGTLSLGHGKVLMMLTNEPAEMVARVAEKAIEDGMSVRQLEEMVQKLMGPPRGVESKVKEWQDPNVRAAEQEIQRTLGCRVTIKDNGGKGKIILEYAGLEDFDRIVEVLGKR
ncbi:MAG: chromosome segregation DNA-binding protein [Acidobacteriales bacterium]|nr:chromosome segregation DNA-binding protein [Terriglobales bacterium]